MPTPYPKSINTAAKREMFDSLRVNLSGVKEVEVAVTAIAEALQVERTELSEILQDRLIKVGVGWRMNLGTKNTPNKVKVLDFIAETCASKSGQEALESLDQTIRAVRKETSTRAASAMANVHSTDRRWKGKRNFRKK